MSEFIRPRILIKSASQIRFVNARMVTYLFSLHVPNEYGRGLKRFDTRLCLSKKNPRLANRSHMGYEYKSPTMKRRWGTAEASRAPEPRTRPLPSRGELIETLKVPIAGLSTTMNTNHVSEDGAAEMDFSGLLYISISIP